MKPLFLAACLFALVTPGDLSAEEAPTPEERLKEKLVGTWRLISTTRNGHSSDLPSGLLGLKHITPSHVTWINFMAESGVVVTMAGGKWQLDGDQYFEMVEYGRGRDYADLKGQTLRFTCRIVGNRWFHSGSFAGGLSFNQIWERVELGDPIKK